ncbi:MAG: hypothetical protein E7316_09000 [Clostridiales bacterium]|nr:hypothetical protein [Clostridiales bacterium]
MMLQVLTWPFRMAAKLIGWILDLAGSMIGFAIGLVFCCLGVALYMTGIGAILGVPMVIFGGGLMLKSIF